MSSYIRVKFISPLSARYFRKQLPAADPAWGNCHFSFDTGDRHYDWLVVYEDIKPAPGQTRNQAFESLACHPDNTLLVTSEPSSIKHYGRAFTRQFGMVLTSQPDWALPHPRRIYSQPAIAWMYGVGNDQVRTFEEISAQPAAAKTGDLSMVYSPKRQRHTLHQRRNDFMEDLMQRLPDMQVFGRGVTPLPDNNKAAALDPCRYHVAIENHRSRHHWTEKLSDAFLGMCLPFYYGCPNATDYFPPDSFIPIDIDDPEGAEHIIRGAIAAGEHEKRLPAITEARRRVLHEYNLFAVLAEHIGRHYRQRETGASGSRLYSRHALRRNSILVGMEDLLGKARSRLIHMARQD